MRTALTALGILWMSLSALPQASPDFQTYFQDRTLRVDYYHIGDAKEEWIAPDRLHLGGPWAGSMKNLVNPFSQGRYCIKVFDAEGKTLL